MFFGIILSNPHDIPSFKNKATVYTPQKKYTLYIVSEEDVKDYIPVVINTGFVEPVKAFQHYNVKNNIKRNTKLVSMKSKLSYSVSENLAPDNFYFQLENPMNSDSTRRNYNYRLFYNEIPCYVTDNTLIENFYQAINQDIGPLIASTHSLIRKKIPHWYTKEIFRDIVDLKQIDMEDKIMIEGYDELYLFYKDDVIFDDDIITEIRGNITASINMKIFPRNTPKEYVKNRELKMTNNGQYIIPYNTDYIDVFPELFQLCFYLNSIEELFAFLMNFHNSLSSKTFNENSKIYLEEKIKIIYSTKYLPDYIKVKELSKLKLLKEIDGVEIHYPKTERGFYDNNHNEWFTLTHPSLRIEKVF